MGYNHAAAFIAAPVADYIRPFTPWFEGPVVGFKPKIEVVCNPINIGKTNTMLLDLRSRWLTEFLLAVKMVNPEIPRDAATEWVNFHFPKTAQDLAASLTAGEPQKLAFRLADAWDKA